MSVTTVNQPQTNNFPPIPIMERNGDFNAPAVTEKKVSYHDFKVLDSIIEGIESKANHSEKPQTKENIQFESNNFDIEFSDFNYSFNFEIIDINWSLSSDQIILVLSLNKKLIVSAILEGCWEQNEEHSFKIENFRLKLVQKQETPISVFLTSTLWAMLGLSSNLRVKIPQLNYDLTASFELPLNEISKSLQERQIAYRLMVIETALGISLPFPDGEIKGEDVESIAFCYHAIVEREFDWFAIPALIPWIANEESLSWLPDSSEPTTVTYRPEPVVKYIFGVGIPLGIMTGRIDKTVIDNYEEVKEKLSTLDGSIVEVKQRSINGVIRMISIQVPFLPPNTWSQKLQKLIDLDRKLDSMYFDKYLNSFSNAFEGLTDEQVQAITERPDLEEEAFNF